MDEKVQAAAAQITKELADRGLLIEGGFRALLLIMGIKDVSQVGYDQLRRAYFAGAQHLFASLIGTMDHGTHETEADMRRMELISRELEKWVEEEKRKNQ